MYGMRMDISVIAYILMLPVILAGIFLIRPSQIIAKIEYIYLSFITIILSIILPANIIVFHFWNNLLNYRALAYLADPKEMFASFSIIQLISGGIVLIIFYFLIYFFFTRKIYKPFEHVYSVLIRKITGWILMIALLIICMRGGLQMLPINESLISFSNDNFINQATANPLWHLSNDVYRAGIFEGNPFEMMPDTVATKKVEDLFSCYPDSFPRIFTTDHPNIVILILESFTADIVGAMGGEKNVSPELDRLISEGVFFNSVYSSGTRTDQGIVSLLNGWPATPFYSIMRSTDKSKKLPSLPKLFLEKNYSTSFFYGGESNFSNLINYIQNQKFKLIIDEKNFDASIPHGRWGVHDEFVLERQINELKNIREPFFSVVMTLSNHEPFDVPGPEKFTGNSEPDMFRNSAAYTDAQVGEYFRKVKNEIWYKNTLFIISADHGHTLPKNTNVYFPVSHKIPFLFYGEVIRSEFRGSAVTKLGNHHDLPAILLPQLHMDSKPFSFSRNLLNPTVKSFAYYQIDNVIGWIDPLYWYGYSYNRKKFLVKSLNVPQEYLDSLQIGGQAFTQKLFQKYKAY